MDKNEIIGRQVKKLRLQHKMTLKQLSEQVGVTSSFLSQVERGSGTLSLKTLSCLAKVFDTDISQFFATSSNISDDLVIRAYERVGLRTSREFSQSSLATKNFDSSFFPEIYEVYPYTNEHIDAIFSHEEEEFIYIIAGVIEVMVNDNTYVLNPGDCVHIPPKAKHSWKNIGIFNAILLGVTPKKDI